MEDEEARVVGTNVNGRYQTRRIVKEIGCGLGNTWNPFEGIIWKIHNGERAVALQTSLPNCKGNILRFLDENASEFPPFFNRTSRTRTSFFSNNTL